MMPGHTNSKYPNPIDNAHSIDDIANKYIDDNLDSNIDSEKLKKVIAKLLPKVDNEKNKKVLRARFGLKPFDKSYTLVQIADAMGVTPEVIRQRQVKALRQLRYHGRDILMPFIRETA
jgi:DNA-directed RNA polymerase sigma subunit (sigma70/sigma32)